MDTQRVKKKRPGTRVYVDISSVHSPAAVFSALLRVGFMLVYLSVIHIIKNGYFGN